jgi:hypothetical protein
VPLVTIAGAAVPTILLQTDRDVGLAAFRSGADILVVLDAAIDFRLPSPTLAPPFVNMTSRRTVDATVICLPVAPNSSLRLARDERGWLVALGPPPSTMASIEPRLIKTGPSAAHIRLSASAPSRVVTVMDPQTGGRLLVGTQDTPGEAVPNEWPQGQFKLLPTLQGVVVVAKSDDILLRREAHGFAIFAGPHGAGEIVSDAERQDPDAPVAPPLSQLFGFPNGPVPDLIRKLNEQTFAAGSAPALARSGPRLQVAATMVALGMGVEAQSVLDIAAADDPALLDMPRVNGLRAVAAVLAHRFGAADAIADPRLNGTIEIELWRALLDVARDQTSEKDALSLSAALPLLMAYPRALRDRFLPEALEAMALNGQAEAEQDTLKSAPQDSDLDLARGMVAEMTNQPAAALQAYDQVAARSDRLPRYKAMVRAAELRLKGGDLDAKAGADALDRALFGWLGDRQEFLLRIRIANLRRQAGQWREALTVLRDGRAAFPDDHVRLDQEIAATFTALFAGDAAQRIAPADFVALYDQNMDLVQNLSLTESVGTKLVDYLVGLGLQGRAEPIQARLVAQSTDPTSRVLLGARLSSLRMTLADPAGAIAALSDTAPPAGGTADPTVMEARQLLYARAESERGNKDVALGMLDVLGTADSDEMRADIYTTRKDWPNTISALTALERKRISSAVDLTEDQQAIVMRLAEAATLGADSATLVRLTETYGASMANGKSAALFRLITSPPVRGTSDLPRAFEENQLARQLQRSLGGGRGEPKPAP